MDLPPLKPTHLSIYRGIARLLIRHGVIDLLGISRIDRSLLVDDQESSGAVRGDPQQLTAELEALGPTFVKLGQLLSTRADLFPEPYLDALGRLQDQVETVPFDAVAKVFAEELDLQIDEAFSEFERRPLASASLGQVHRARLRNGRRVAVKILRPGIRGSMRDELDAVLGIARLLDDHTDIGRRYAFGPMIEELRSTLLRELDYRQEAQNLIGMAEKFADSDRIVIPEPVEALCSIRVLTMDFVDGTKIIELSAIGRTELDGAGLARELCEAYTEQMLLDGFFHADPHPGNVLLTSDGKLAMVDLGMVARLSPGFRQDLLKLVFGMAEGAVQTVVEQCETLGDCLEDYDKSSFQRRVNRLILGFEEAGNARRSFGRLVFDLGRAAADCGLRPPPELAIVGKTLLHLDEVGRQLDRDFNANQAIQERLTSIATRHMLRSMSPRRAFAAAFELNEFVQKLPRRVNKVLDALVERELEVRIRAFDESRMMASLQRIGSRITLGLVSAALIVGASLIMRTEARTTILGYPWLGVLLLLLGVGASILLVAGIVIQDFRDKRG